MSDRRINALIVAGIMLFLFVTGLAWHFGDAGPQIHCDTVYSPPPEWCIHPERYEPIR